MISLPEAGDKAFLREVWVLYAIGVAVIFLRFTTRIKTVGLKGFQGDDFFSILTLLFYTIDAATVHIIFYEGTNVEASVLRGTQTFSSADIQRFELGSKLQLVAWYSYTALIWCMKATMLFFFYRLTVGLWQHQWIKWIGLACGISYLAVVSTITFGCFPTWKNWQVVPDPGLRCTLKLQNFLVTVVLNVITDALILAVPVPLLWTLRIPLRRKIVISLLLCSGLFVIAAAIIRVALTLDNNPSATNINRWGVRETIVGILTINAPILRPMFTRKFWSRAEWKNTSLEYGESRNLEGGNAGGAGSIVGKAYELSSSGGSKGSGRRRGSKGGPWETAKPVPSTDLERGLTSNKKQRRPSVISIGSFQSRTGSLGSEEYIIQGKNRERQDPPLEVNIQTEFSVETETIKEMIPTGEEQREEEWQREDFGATSARR